MPEGLTVNWRYCRWERYASKRDREAMLMVLFLLRSIDMEYYITTKIVMSTTLLSPDSLR